MSSPNPRPRLKSFPDRWMMSVGLLAFLAISAGRSAAQTPSGRAPEGLKFANGLLRERRYDLAADEFERFLKSEPGDRDAAEARFGLGRARLFLSQFAEAKAQFEEFLKLAPGHPNAPTALFRLGEASFLMGDNASARKALEAYISQYPEGIHRDSALPELGDACSALGDLPAARRAYEKALEVEPSGRLAGRTRFHLGRTLASQGEQAEAIKVLETLARSGDAEWSGRAKLQIGQVLASSGRWDEAIVAFAEVERLKPPGVSAGEVRLRKAEALIRAGRGDEAEAILAPLAAQGPKNVAMPAAYALAGSWIDRGQPARALELCDSAVSRAGDSPWASRLIFRSAEAALKEGKADDAKSRFLRVLRDFPKDAWAPSALVRAARLALDGRDMEAAAALTGEFPSRFPGHPLAADAHLIAGRAAWGAGKPREAIATLRALLAEDKPNAEVAQSAAYYLGLAYKADGQPDKAAKLLEDLARTPGASASADAQLVLAYGHFEAKRYAEAASAFDRYLAARPKGDDASQALADLATCRDALGQADAARDTLDRLAADWPRSEALPRARIVLGESALDAKRYDEAAATFRPVAESNDPKWKARALSGLGWALFQGGHPDEAAAAFASLLAAAPDDPLAPDAALMKGRSLEAANKPDEAMAAFGLVLEKYPQSDRKGPALLAKARLLAASGKPGEAAEDFARYVQDPPREGPPLDTVLVDWGWALHDAGKSSEADAAFRRVAEEFGDGPRSADARVFLAESEFAAGKLQEAADRLAPVVAEGSRADPELIQTALLRLARIDLARGDLAGASKHFDRLLTAHPEGKFRDEARFGQAETKLKLGDPTGADAGFAALAGASGDWPDLARLGRVQCLIALGRWADALAAADALKAHRPKLPRMAELEYARGRSLQMQARFDEARSAYQATIAAAPATETAAMAQWMRGETYLHQKNYPEALREFHKTDLAYHAPEWQALALLEAGKVYDLLNRPIDAIDVYEKFRVNFPRDKHLDDVNRRWEAAKKKLAPTTPES